MDSKPKKSMNASVNVIKFIMAVFIFLMHSSIFFGDKYFQGSYIFVEWFYVLVGYTLARTIINLSEDGEVLTNSTKIIYKRIAKLVPYYIASCLVALVLKIHFKEIVIRETWDINKIVHEMLLLQMTTIEVTTLTGTAWFLSSMIISLIIIVPIFIKLRKKFYVVAIVFATLIYYYIFKKSGYLWRPVEFFITYKGNLRAMAAILLGICGYAISPFFANLMNDDKKSNLIRVAVILGYLAVFIYVMKVDDSIIYFALPYIFMILISAGMNLDNKLIKDNEFTRFLGDMSMVLFMNHYYVSELIQKLRPYLSLRAKYFYATIGSFAISIIIYLIIKLIISRLFSKIIKNL